MKRVAGFTLLELLIGLSLLGFILALLFGGFRLAVNSWDTVERHFQQDNNKHAALALLRRLLGTVEPVRQKRSPGQPLAFAGLPDRLLMVAPLTEQIGLRTIELAIEPKEGNSTTVQRLVLRHGPLPYETLNPLDTLSNSDSRVLMDDLQNASFGFFGALQSGERPAWHDAWVSPNDLPTLVRVHVSRKGDEPVDLVVATIISPDRNAVVRITAGPPQ